jgi:hypothetical protein
MKKKTFAVERDDLAAYPTTELKRMAHFVHTVGENLAGTNNTMDVAVLTDLEGAVSDELVDICNVLNRVERRIGRELAKRN